MLGRTARSSGSLYGRGSACASLIRGLSAWRTDPFTHGESPSGVAEAAIEERLGHAEGEQRRQPEIDDGDDDGSARRDRVEGLRLRRVSRLEPAPGLEPAEEKDQQHHRAREEDG